MIDELFGTLEPVAASLQLELVDVEHRSGALVVTVDRPGGVDFDSLVRADRAVSAALDGHPALPGRYTLEVSSPGVERSLRRPDHFVRAVGEIVSIKTRPQVPGERRLRGRLVEADADGFVLHLSDESRPASGGTGGAPGAKTSLEPHGEDGRTLRMSYSDIDRARTVFEWGPAPRPGSAGHKSSGAKGPTSRAAGGRGRTKDENSRRTERKQVATS